MSSISQIQLRFQDYSTVVLEIIKVSTTYLYSSLIFYPRTPLTNLILHLFMQIYSGMWIRFWPEKTRTRGSVPRTKRDF